MQLEGVTAEMVAAWQQAAEGPVGHRRRASWRGSTPSARRRGWPRRGAIPDELSQQERLLRVRGCGEKAIEQLATGGYHTVEDIVNEQDLMQARRRTGLGIKKARQLKHCRRAVPRRRGQAAQGAGRRARGAGGAERQAGRRLASTARRPTAHGAARRGVWPEPLSPARRADVRNRSFASRVLTSEQRWSIRDMAKKRVYELAKELGMSQQGARRLAHGPRLRRGEEPLVVARGGPGAGRSPRRCWPTRKPKARAAAPHSPGFVVRRRVDGAPAARRRRSLPAWRGGRGRPTSPQQRRGAEAGRSAEPAAAAQAAQPSSTAAPAPPRAGRPPTPRRAPAAPCARRPRRARRPSRARRGRSPGSGRSAAAPPHRHAGGRHLAAARFRSGA